MWPHLVFYHDAFHDLGSTRALGAMGGCGEIPWTAIDQYADRYDLDDPDAFETFKQLVRAQDRVYLKDVASKVEKPPKP